MTGDGTAIYRSAYTEDITLHNNIKVKKTGIFTDEI